MEYEGSNVYLLKLKSFSYPPKSTLPFKIESINLHEDNIK